MKLLCNFNNNDCVTDYVNIDIFSQIQAPNPMLKNESNNTR